MISSHEADLRAFHKLLQVFPDEQYKITSQVFTDVFLEYGFKLGYAIENLAKKEKRAILVSPKQVQEEGFVAWLENLKQKWWGEEVVSLESLAKRLDYIEKVLKEKGLEL